MVYLNDRLLVATATSILGCARAIFSVIATAYFVYAICTVTFWIIASHIVIIISVI